MNTCSEIISGGGRMRMGSMVRGWAANTFGTVSWILQNVLTSPGFWGK